MPRSKSRMSERRSIKRVIDGFFELNKGIRFVAIYQDQYLLAGGMRRGVGAYDPDDSYDVDMQLAKIGAITRAWQRWFGDLQSITLRYERLSLVFQPLGGGRFLVMSAEPEVDIMGILSDLSARPDFKTLSEAIP